MALKLYHYNDTIRLLAAYEDGRLGVFATPAQAHTFHLPRREEGEGWSLIWYQQGHTEPSPFKRSTETVES